MTVPETCVAIGLISLLVGVLLPALGRAREAARRTSCANNLKQICLVLKMYANEWNGRFPPLNPVPHNWMLDGWAVYPEYLTDLSVFICPDSPFADDYTFRLRDDFDHRGAIIGSYHPDCLSSLFYNYTGYFIESNEMAAAVFNAYYEMPYEAFVNHDLQLDVPVWTDSDLTSGHPGIPVLWDRVPLDEHEFAHRPLGGNVLYVDGHVEFVPYSYYNDSSFFPMTRISAETFGSVLPRLSRDCYAF